MASHFPLQNDQVAPPFKLDDCYGNPWSLEEQKGKMVCLYFARGEYCPTTRGEFSIYNSFAHIIRKMNCEPVFLVNGGEKEHAKFATELRMRLPILIDHDGSVGTSYGVYGPNHMDMKRDDYKNYIAPAVYLINADSTIGGFWLSSTPRGMPMPESILGMLAYAQSNNWKY